MASHSTLQYLPAVTLQVHGGCAHFSFFSAATGISFWHSRRGFTVLPERKNLPHHEEQAGRKQPSRQTDGSAKSQEHIHPGHHYDRAENSQHPMSPLGARQQNRLEGAGGVYGETIKAEEDYL
jgi:hypothetical protein